MSDSDQKKGAPEGLPKARVQRNWKSYFIWLVPLAAALVAGWFIYSELISKGPKITIYFDDAAGLQKGKSQMKYRGVVIGTVEKVDLTEDTQRTKVAVRLKKSAEQVAREGSRFWIVQPHVGLEEIRGLGTIVSGDYLTVQPGGGKEKTTFIGLSEPPAPPKEQHGRRIVLIAERLGSVKKHAPVMYRGIQVGEVIDYDLGPESRLVYIMVDIKKGYAPLVRMNSQFWNAGGINVDIGFSGVNISAQSAQAILTGGIDFATPDTKAPEVQDGTAFRLYDKVQNGWLTWNPPIRLPPHEKPSGQTQTPATGSGGGGGGGGGGL